MREREREHEQRRGRKGGRERMRESKSQAGPTLSMAPNVGLDPTTMKS